MTRGDAVTPYRLLVVGFLVALVFGLIVWHVGRSGQTADAAGPSLWGDVNCSGGVDSNDVVVLLRDAASLPTSQPGGCPDVGTSVTTIQAATTSQMWGDNDCSGAPDTRDALATLLYVAGFSSTQIQSQTGTCPVIGASISTEPQHRAILYITGIASDGNCDTPWGLPGSDSDPGWLWISDPLMDAGGIAYDDFVEYIYRDGGSDHPAPDCSSSSPDDPFPYYTFDRHDSCWSLDNSIDPDVGSALKVPPSGSGAPKGQAEKLRDFIKRYIQGHPGVQLSIIAHSQGGVLAAYTLAKYHSDPDIAKVSNLVTLDSPLQGIRNLAATDVGISQVRSWFFNCDGNDDKRYDSIWDMLPEALSPREVIREITYPGNWTNATSLYSINEKAAECLWSTPICMEMIPDSETRFGWELGHLCVTTGSHAKLANGRGDTLETQKVVEFIKRALLGPTPRGNSNCQEATYSIGGTVYIDSNGNGAKDGGEDPYINATVTLADDASTTTDLLGHYSFSGLASGSYTVELVVPVNYEATTSYFVSKTVPPDATVNFGIRAVLSGNDAPNPPSPYFPPDGGTIYSGMQPDICWDSNGDPDGDSLQFKVVVSKMLVNGDTNNFEFGWTNDTCIPDLGDLTSFLQNQGMNSGTFAWHVLARDPGGLLSDWSPCWGNVSPVGSIPDCYGNPWWLYFTLFVGLPPPPAAPSNLTATPVDPYGIRLDWIDNSSSEVGFEITDAVTSVLLPINTESYVWGGLEPGTYKCFKIRAYNFTSNSDWEPPYSPYYVCTTTPTITPCSTVIVDDTSSGFGHYGTAWSEQSVGYNGHMWWAPTNATSQSSYAYWSASLSGIYDAFVYIPSSYATTQNATYVINTSSGLEYVGINQNSYSNQWVYVGTFDFSTGYDVVNGYGWRINLSNGTGEPDGAYAVGFDAVSFEPCPRVF